MGKFILTNSVAKTSESISFSTANGYVVSGKYENEKISFASYYKLAIKNENFLSIGDDFVSVTGTVIYKDTIGQESLRMIYNDFTGDINVIRDNVLGNGAFIIKKGVEITVFTEYLAMYHVFYTENNGDFILSNELYDVCKLCSGLEVDNENLLLNALIAGVYDKDTEIKNVFCLRDCEKLVINIANGEYHFENVNVEWRSNQKLSYNEIVERIGDYLKQYATMFTKHYGTPGLSSTGGLDNRLNLASFLAAGSKPDLYYGIGNSPITNTNDGDLTINKYYKEKYDLNLQVVSWENATPINHDWQELEKLYGMHSLRYAGSKDFNQHYTNVDNQLILFGCVGEIYRIDDNIYLEDINFSNFTLDQYIDLYDIDHYRASAQLLFKDRNSIHAHIKNKLLPLCKKWGLDPNNLTPMDDMILWLERMRRSDVLIPNLINRHHFCAFMNAQLPIVRLLTLVNPREKRDAKFHIDLLRYLYPSIMEVPIFSRTRFQIYDEEKGKMILPAKVRFEQKVKRLLPESLANAARWFIGKTKTGKKREEDNYGKNSVPIIRDILEKHGLIDGRDVTVSLFDRLDKQVLLYAQELTIFDNLGISFKN